MIKLKLLAAALIALLVAAACGGGVDATATTEAGALTPQARDTTGTPTPTATTPIPTATPIPAPGVEIPTPVSYIPDLGDIAYGYVETIVNRFGQREAATDGELAAAEFIAAELESFGYEPEVHSFNLQVIDDSEPWLRVTSDGNREIEALFMFRTGFGDVEGTLVNAGLGLEDDFPQEGLDGAVALIERGEIDFEEKAQNAAAAGASAVIIYNSEPDNFSGTLQTQSEVPVLSLSQDDGQALAAIIESGEITVRVRVVTNDRESRNVVAVKEGSNPDAPGIVVGAHFDADEESVGANDNASGTAALLAVARALKDDTFASDVTFAAFGSSGLGLIGAQSFAGDLLDEDAPTVGLMINLDVVGSGERAIVAGDPITQLEILRLGTELGVSVSPGNTPEGVFSEHIVFQALDIPTAFFFADDLSRVNTPEDTIEFVDSALLGDIVNLVVALVRSGAGR